MGFGVPAGFLERGEKKDTQKNNNTQNGMFVGVVFFGFFFEIRLSEGGKKKKHHSGRLFTWIFPRWLNAFSLLRRGGVTLGPLAACRVCGCDTVRRLR